MNVGVIHDSLNFAGGAERVCLKTIEALQENGYHVILGTVEPTNWDHVRKILEDYVRPDEEIHLLGFRFGMLRSYLDMLVPILVRKIRKKCRYCINTNADVLPTNTEVNYLHYVPGSASRGEFHREEFFAAGLYSVPYHHLQHNSLRNLVNGRLLTNSRFSQRAIKECLDLNAEVVYPPVELGQFLTASSMPKSNRVITTGRMSPERHFEFMLLVADEMPDVEFTIIGHLSGALSRSYYERLCNIKNRKKLVNVSIILNDSFSKMLSLFASSKIFLHTMRNEAFGLSVVEAMASGLVPVVIRSGGPWEDILDRNEGGHGYSYSNVTEAVGAISFVLSENGVYSSIVSRNRLKVESFSDIAFKSKITQVVNESWHR